MIEVFLGLSILLNGFLIWYIIKLIKKFLNISEELEDFFVLLEEYSEHVDIVYNLERFYGDTTLESLLRHSRSISEQAKDFRAIYDVNYDPDQESDQEDEESE